MGLKEQSQQRHAPGGLHALYPLQLAATGLYSIPTCLEVGTLPYSVQCTKKSPPRTDLEIM